jgi:hypothetical protein
LDCATPTAFLALCCTSPVLGVASIAESFAPTIFSFTLSTFPVTDSLARDFTSAL